MQRNFFLPGSSNGLIVKIAMEESVRIPTLFKFAERCCPWFVMYDTIEGSNMIFARGFQPTRGTLRMLMNDKIMFDRYYCINSTKHCENEENIGALYFITSPHFPTRVRYAIFGPRSSTHYLARALRDAW